MGVLMHAATCRSEPKLSHGGLFFHDMSKLWTLCCTDISEVAGSSVVYVPGPFWGILGSIFACQFFSIVAQMFAVLVLFCHVIHCFLVWLLKPVPLSENDGTLDQQLEACRSMPQQAKIFLGTVGALPAVQGAAGL